MFDGSDQSKSKVDTECGIKLLTRILSKKRPTLVNLSPEIFPIDSPKPGEIFEISGDSGSGKTTNLMELIARTVIPLEFGGKGASVIVIDTNSNFHVSLLLPVIIEKHVIYNRTSSCQSTDTEVLVDATSNVSAIVLDAMKKIVFFKCYSSTEYELTLLYCSNYLLTNTNVSLIVVDSIATFYWSDFSEQQLIRMDTYLRRRVQELRKLTDEFKVVIAYTRPMEFGSNSTAMSYQQANYKIQLKPAKANDEWREARNYYSNQQISRRFSINDFGIKWMSSIHQ
ncbi:DNA repair protein XRCC2-like [Contarinia nasturtii]|uniref:DNA repair protein XRCC2-like n=1 Tax=Contarinia nasturtii TaxID=265458 RepID=UPI0012D384AA|nr:DNA repair protein XRCC2-like [Contarinia nasturtii]